MRFVKYAHRAEATYYVSDRLRDGRMAVVPGREIATIVSAWLAELGAHSPLVEDLARAACVGDWTTACAVGDQLSVDVTVRSQRNYPWHARDPQISGPKSFAARDVIPSRSRCDRTTIDMTTLWKGPVK
jgi:hypothetical protein